MKKESRSTRFPFKEFKWKRISHGVEFGISCCECRRRKSSKVAWADLNGPAFRAYYCDQCKRHIDETEAA